MRYLIIVIGLLFSSSLFAQTDNKGQSIELPDFVITGVQSLDVPVASKKKAEYVPTISEEFLMPSYSPEEFSLSPGSGIVGKKIELFDEIDSFEGGIKIGAGQHTLPVGEFHFSQNWNNYLLYADVWTSNIKDYVDNAAFKSTGASLKNNFFISTDSEFLPGLKISLNGEYNRNDYKFFGSTVTPTLERKAQNGLALLALDNSYDDNVNFGIDFAGRYFSLSDNDFDEVVANAGAYLDLKFKHFGIKYRGLYKHQFLTNNLSAADDNQYFSNKIAAVIKPSNALQFNVGVFYSKFDDETFIMPVASFSYRLEKNIYMFGEFNPRTEFLTVSDFVGQNRYYELSTMDNALMKYNADMQLAVKYEFEEYWEVTAGVKLSMFDNFVYYQDINSDGKFELNQIDDVKDIGIFANTIFHLGPMGQLYGNLAVKQVTDSDGDFIPYQPVVRSSFIYAYDFDFGLELSVEYDLAMNIHTDMAVFGKLNDYHNLACTARYKLSENFEMSVQLQNILQKDNYLMQNYEDKPFDIIGGIYYHW